MSIRFASAASAVAFIASFATPAFASDTEAAVVGPVDNAATEITGTEITIAPDAAVALRAIEPIDLATASYQSDAEPAITVSGSATLTSDYRFRGVSQTDEGMAIQGGFTISHASGAYIGTWGSNLAGWGTFGGANMELDIFAGYAMPVGEGTLDVGGTWFMYPSGADTTDFVEFYAKLSGDAGPLSLTAGVAYAPSQEALGKVFLTGAAAAAGIPDDAGDKEDNLYLFGDASFAIPDSPLSISAHLGYSDGNAGLGPNGTSIAPTGTYFDWSVTAAVTALPGLDLAVAYVDTDISQAESAYLLPNFAKLDGGRIAGSTIVFSVTASF
ncbi:TorF family putative porin [Porphyrobacter sp. AAP60]|uniref:TorF family putative porin n=1 Tax=Porphyrobacter sp. AAP60 TaxID=1523423 RepID=UPI0009E66E9C|nr:TorF family putative porin [Porphyrobacter sp. AAP60]